VSKKTCVADSCFVNGDHHGSQFDFYLKGRILELLHSDLRK